MSIMKRVVLALVIALLTTANLWGGALAAGPTTERAGHVAGEVTAINGKTLTVHTPGGDKSVVTNDQTHFQVYNVAHATLADVHVHDMITAEGQLQSDGSLLAAELEVRAPRPVLEGRVKSIAGDHKSFEVTVGRDSTKTVKITDTTLFRIPGKDSASVTDLKVGDMVMVWGTADNQGVVTATTVLISRRQPEPRPQLRVVAGKITGLDTTNKTITVETRERDQTVTKTVHVTGETRYVMPGITPSGFAGLKVGDMIVATGRPNATDATMLDAALIVVTRHRQP